MWNKSFLKQLLGELPYTAELYWSLRQPGKPVTPKFSLRKLDKHLPDWVADVGAGLAPAQEARSGRGAAGAGARPASTTPGRHILIFATLRYWIEHAALLGLALRGMGNRVTLAFLPYSNWKRPANRFDLRRQNAYALSVLRKAEPLLEIASFYPGGSLVEGKKGAPLPADLEQAVWQNAWRDTQYSLQLEEVDPQSELFRLRLERDTAAACAALSWMQANRPEAVIVPNGTILEFGAVYQAARWLGQAAALPVITYEFGEQRGRIWLAQNAEVMRQDTDALWNARKETALTPEQLDQVRALFAARQRASLWENFARRWQGVPSAGGEMVRLALGLDSRGEASRPVVLLATNVIGDSLTLGRQVFSDSMTEWLERTVLYFARRPDVQFVIRIHPGELITRGPSVGDLVQRTLSGFSAQETAHIHLVPAGAQVNTYDIVEIADLGLVYTTTVGMEMAMSGIPVIAVGRTHYRGKGFSLDPDTWEGYFELLDRVLAAPGAYRLTRQQVELAWNYAYHFFFEFPLPFPWHLLQFWKDQAAWPVSRVLGEEGQAQFGRTLRALAGEPLAYD